MLKFFGRAIWDFSAGRSIPRTIHPFKGNILFRGNMPNKPPLYKAGYSYTLFKANHSVRATFLRHYVFIDYGNLREMSVFLYLPSPPARRHDFGAKSAIRHVPAYCGLVVNAPDKTLLTPYYSPPSQKSKVFLKNFFKVENLA